MSIIQRISEKIPEFCLSHWLFRIPLAIIFIQQGMSKLPVSIEDAESFGLPYLVWWFVTYGELGAGLGLVVGGILNTDKLWPWIGDMLSRFSGIVICCIMTGVIWVGEPESLLDVILYDNLHVFLWVGGLFFALRGNRAK
jgi:putative oxidoreductase|tara:strand:+ start:466 stop:885 length:420 start_codon:yes stop_codon:yes gene_type:complete